ncbi:hypothetical protein SAMD00019534_077110 [Acytostelium subglobosum LB1]|uniref:hypothetical protein n=1 Tax=Acytostelium subglobosum LB1 TaxID=1410327 RepID=UPI000644B2D3|nr:hypothetical protein SAMD00019534_077110 [Acytostelium subglobosum LB1]GAM24536.1 hypothetical protein SAMD00019534_077110 [Acytostelium subglobosum LB1]|eukprot:XP_012752862.1 hypothetical protein SAMD00019534_077110 [Acytostelium subglobosum LB1]
MLSKLYFYLNNRQQQQQQQQQQEQQEQNNVHSPAASPSSSPSPSPYSTISSTATTPLTTSGDTLLKRSTLTSSSSSSFSKSTSTLAIRDRDNPPIEHILKILVLGGNGVGKSSVIRRYLQDCFTVSHIPTIGTDLSTLFLESTQSVSSSPSNNMTTTSTTTSPTMTQQTLTTTQSSTSTTPLTKQWQPQSNILATCCLDIQFLDVAHAEINGKHLSSILHSVAGIILVLDLTNAASIVSVDEWKSVLRQRHLDHRIPIVLFANKQDVSGPVLSNSDLDNYCKASEYSFWKATSCRRDVGIRDGIDGLLDIVVERKHQELKEKSRLQQMATLQHSPSVDIPSQSSAGSKMLVSSSLPTIKLNLTGAMSTPTKKSTITSTISTPPLSQPSQSFKDVQTVVDDTTATTNKTTQSTSQTSQQSSSQTQPKKQQQQQQEKLKNIIQPSDVMKITELQSMTTDFYTRLAKSLEELLLRSNGSRYRDLSMLERQRAHEYTKICNNIKKLVQPNHGGLAAHGHVHSQQQGHGSPGGSRTRVTKEYIQTTLEENMKKWSTLLDNLQLESKLNEQTMVSSSLPDNEANNARLNGSMSQSFSSTSSSLLSNHHSQHHGHQQQHGHQHHHHHHHRSGSISSSHSSISSSMSNNTNNSNKWKMGFGFRSHGFKAVCILQV